MNHGVRDILEVLMVIGVGGLLVSSIRRLRKGEISAVSCQSCFRPTSRAYPQCRWCGSDVMSAHPNR